MIERSEAPQEIKNYSQTDEKTSPIRQTERAVFPVNAQDTQDLPRVDFKTRQYTDQDGQNWVALSFFRKNFKDNHRGLKRLLAQVPTMIGKSASKNNQFITLYAKTQAEEILTAYKRPQRRVKTITTDPNQLPMIDRETKSHTNEQGSWMTAMELCSQLEVSSGKLNSVLGEVPWIPGRTSVGHRTRLYNQAQAMTLLHAYTDAIAAERGWMTNNNLANELERGFMSIRRKANEFRDDHPEWFQQRKIIVGRSKRVVDVYSPELVEIIRNQLLQQQISPENWETIGGLTVRLKKEGLSATYYIVKGLVNKYQEDHPDWVHDYELKGAHDTRVLPHLAPELIALISDGIKNPTTKNEPKDTTEADKFMEDIAFGKEEI